MIRTAYTTALVISAIFLTLQTASAHVPIPEENLVTVRLYILGLFGALVLFSAFVVWSTYTGKGLRASARHLCRFPQVLLLPLVVLGAAMAAYPVYSLKVDRTTAASELASPQATTLPVKWPPVSEGGRAVLADPSTDVIRWQRAGAARKYVVVIRQVRYSSLADSRTTSVGEYVVAGKEELALAEMPLQISASLGSRYPAEKPVTAHKEVLYTVQVFAIEAGEETPFWKDKPVADQHRFRLQQYDLMSLRRVELLVMDVDDLRYASWEAARQGRRLENAARMLAEAGYYDSAEALARQMREKYLDTPYYRSRYLSRENTLQAIEEARERAAAQNAAEASPE